LLRGLALAHLAYLGGDGRPRARYPIAPGTGLLGLGLMRRRKGV
jgi:hypothetical protein